MRDATKTDIKEYIKKISNLSFMDDTELKIIYAVTLVKTGEVWRQRVY